MRYPKFWIYIIAAIVAAMIVACLCSCNQTRQTRTVENIKGTTFDVIVIDSCEYLIGSALYEGYMAHKGNCKYCEQRHMYKR
jgi:hypothetical protein